MKIYKMRRISDVGMEWDIHPKKKKPVGHRLALQAKNKVYGQDVLCEAPTLISAEYKNDRLILEFDNAGEGLYIESENNVLSGAKIRFGEEEIDTNKLRAEAYGNKVILYGIREADGVGKVIFGEGGWYIVNLYNSAGIPARPAIAEF